ncbi:MAG: platelet-activating factor acetylhydrolase IB subunit [Sedimentisphaerales bacterium]
MKKISIALFCSTILICGCICSGKTNPCDVNIGSHAAVTPAPRNDQDWWMPRHNAILERIKKGNVDLIMIGDSITHYWEEPGKQVWDQYYAKRNAVNMGFSGDKTEHVLWRLQNGEIDGINPKLAVLMIGTNNSDGDYYTAEQIADGIKAIVCQLRTKLPNTKVLILAIFPRGEKPSPQRQKNEQASELASKIADNKWIYYLDINSKFLEKDGFTLSKKIMPDLLHPQQKGYKIWAQAMEPTIIKLMGEKK